MKAILYLRVSTASQAEEGVSLAAQESKLRAWAKMNDAAGVHVFRDEGISGKKIKNRPGLTAALAAIGKGDVLAVHSLSRLSRSTCDLLELAEELRDRGANLVSMSEKIDTSAAIGKFFFTILAAICQLQREEISERTATALAYKRGRGEKTGGAHPPFGFNIRRGRNGGKPRLVPNPAEQRTIRAMVRRRTRGESLRTIGAAFGGKDVATIRRILAREERAR